MKAWLVGFLGGLLAVCIFLVSGLLAQLLWRVFH
jgi:hypothetical protein